MNFIELINTRGSSVQKQKKEHVFVQGEAEKALYIVESGLLKAYYTSEDGKEMIKSFISPGNIIGSLSSFYAGGNSSFSLICLEKTCLKKISFELINKYCKSDLELANNMIELLLQFAFKKENREYEFLCLSAENRFVQIAKNSPDFLKKITQNDLASYLGITPVGLSRIKKRTGYDLNQP